MTPTPPAAALSAPSAAETGQEVGREGVGAENGVEGFVADLPDCPVCNVPLNQPAPAITVPRALLEDLVDPDGCWFDHRGGCQAHGYLDLRSGEICPQAELKVLLA